MNAEVVSMESEVLYLYVVLAKGGTLTGGHILSRKRHILFKLW